MGQHLVLTVRFHGDGQGTGRFHGNVQGTPEWPPAPGRVFQALVAGVSRGNRLPEEVVPALEWLESLPPPVIAAPHRVLGQRVSYFVPNNDADALADPRNISEIRTGKVFEPCLFNADEPLLYAWPLSDGPGSAEVIVEAADQLYQLGRGVDAAWAVGAVLDDAALEASLQAHRGLLHVPNPAAATSRALACPVVGSVESLVRRHRSPKLRQEGVGRKARILFTNPPKARFASVSYERARAAVVFELRDAKDQPWPWALDRIVGLVERLRDEAAGRLRRAFPELDQEIERTLIGRKSDGRDDGPIADRVRIVPLPSIGSVHADQAIRRFVLEVPSGGPVARGDVEWAFSGLGWANAQTGEVPWTAVRSDDGRMLRHYAGPSRLWRSVTPVALPESARRRRIDPARRDEERKGSAERLEEESRAVAAVHIALRQAGVQGVATNVRVQREPFEGRGKRAEEFAAGTRFAKERLWHVELELDRMSPGPIVIGDGRFLGLGLMAPIRSMAGTAVDGAGHRELAPDARSGVIALQVRGQVRDESVILARALRRAVMARVQEELGRTPLGTFFTGHGKDGRKVEGDGATHLAFQWDARQQRLLLICPHVLDRRQATRKEQENLRVLERALGKLDDLRAGVAGRTQLAPISIGDDDRLLLSSSSWVSVSPYSVNRHPKNTATKDAIAQDVIRECQARSLPRPQVTVLDARGVPGEGLQGSVRLDFAVAVPGPIVLGRTRYLGGGLFEANPSS